MNINPEVQSRIDGLLASDPNNISSEVISSAVADFKKQQEDAQRKMVVRQLGVIADYTDDAVTTLRNARKAERKAKAYLDAVALAESNFKVNGNWDEYTLVRADADTKFHSDK